MGTKSDSKRWEGVDAAAAGGAAVGAAVALTIASSGIALPIAGAVLGAIGGGGLGRWANSATGTSMATGKKKSKPDRARVSGGNPRKKVYTAPEKV
jgi:hypothetical protein